jgi:hypothetical protein
VGFSNSTEDGSLSFPLSLPLSEVWLTISVLLDYREGAFDDIEEFKLIAAATGSIVLRHIPDRRLPLSPRHKNAFRLH